MRAAVTSLVDAGLPPHPNPLPRGGRGRQGLSLIEVLISMFVMTIGLLGLAALIPVGQLMMSRGAIEEQKAIVGRQALRDFNVQGLLKPLNILDGRTNANDPNRWVPADAAKFGPLFADFDAFCFDPLAISRHGRAANAFPAAPGTGAPWMVRVWPLKFANAAAASPDLPRIMAEQLCMSQDDLLYVRPDSGDQMAYPLAKLNASTGAEENRTFEGNFSWLATAVRDVDASTVGSASLDRDTFTVSVVVFHRRALGAPGVIDELINAERTGQIVPATVPNLKGGGDARLRENVLPSAEPLSLKPGRWVLLCAPHVGSTGNNLPGGYFRWYRLRAANQVPRANPNDPPQWDISLAGPDWPVPPTQNVYVVAPEGVVGVYERTMRIERPSLYNGWQ